MYFAASKLARRLTINVQRPLSLYPALTNAHLYSFSSYSAAMPDEQMPSQAIPPMTGPISNAPERHFDDEEPMSASNTLTDVIIPKKSGLDEFNELVNRGNVTLEEFQHYFYLFCRQFRVIEAIDVLAEMKNSNFPPSQRMYEYVLRLAALKLPHSFTRSVFLDGNIVPTPYDQNFGRIIRHIVSFMKRENMQFSESFYIFLIINVFNRPDAIHQALQVLKARGFKVQNRVYNRLLQLHALDENLAVTAFKDIYKSHKMLGLLDEVSFLILVHFLLRRSCTSELFEEFEKLKDEGSPMLTVSLCTRLVTVINEAGYPEEALKMYRLIKLIDPLYSSSGARPQALPPSKGDDGLPGVEDSDEKDVESFSHFVWHDPIVTHDESISTLPDWVTIGLAAADSFIAKQQPQQAKILLAELSEACSSLPCKPSSLLALEIKYAYLFNKDHLADAFQAFFDSSTSRSQAAIITLMETLSEDVSRSFYSSKLLLSDLARKDPVITESVKEYVATEDASGLLDFQSEPTLNILHRYINAMDSSVGNLLKFYLIQTFPTNHKVFKAVVKNLYDASQHDLFVDLIHTLVRHKIVQRRVDAWIGSRYLTKFFLVSLQRGSVNKMLDVARLIFAPGCRYKIPASVHQQILDFAETEAVPKEIKAKYLARWKAINAKLILSKRDPMVSGLKAASNEENLQRNRGSGSRERFNGKSRSNSQYLSS